MGSIGDRRRWRRWVVDEEMGGVEGSEKIGGGDG